MSLRRFTKRQKQERGHLNSQPIWKERSRMEVARIVGPPGPSAVLLLLSYLSLNDTNSGFDSILLLAVGTALAIAGSAAILSNK